MFDEEATEDFVRKAKLLRQQHIDDIESVLSTPQGKRLIWRILEYAGVFRTSFTADPYTTAFNEGRRSSGLFLLDEIERVSPGVLGAMMKEFKDE